MKMKTNYFKLAPILFPVLAIWCRDLFDEEALAIYILLFYVFTFFVDYTSCKHETYSEKLIFIVYPIMLVFTIVGVLGF